MEVREIAQEALNVAHVGCVGLALAGEGMQVLELLYVVTVFNPLGTLEVQQKLVLCVQVQKAAVALLAAELDKVCETEREERVMRGERERSK